jgi:serine protease Do
MRGFGEIAEHLRRATVQVLQSDQRSSGSGVIWASDGLILTNAHVARAPAARVELWDGRRFDARVVSRDTRRDLAALRIAASSLDAAIPGDSSSLRPGELVMAIGNPLGFVGALSSGVVHSVGIIPGMGRQRWIRADVRLAPGNSGGPLANAHGQVVGINTAIVNGLGVAASAATAVEFLQQGPRPALGTTLRPASTGLLILELEPDGAAAASSLQVGDVLVTSMDELNDLLDSGKSVVRLRFLRGNRGQVREVSVRLTARAEAA